jgi:hypothetical protein
VEAVVYLLCAATSAACAFLLLRGYYQRKARLLLWSGICFVGLALNNALLLVDTQVVPDVNLSVIRSIPAVIGVGFLVFGLVWDSHS